MAINQLRPIFLSVSMASDSEVRICYAKYVLFKFDAYHYL